MEVTVLPPAPTLPPAACLTLEMQGTGAGMHITGLPGELSLRQHVGQAQTPMFYLA